MSRFVFISTCVGPWGGSEELWAAAAGRLAQDGHSVTAFRAGVDPNHPRISWLRGLGCGVRDLSRAGLPSSVPLPKSVHRLTATLRAQRAMLPLVRAYLAYLDPDLVVISQGGNFDGASHCNLCRATGRPYVVISQKATDHRWPPDRERSATRSAYESALRSYFVSQHNLQLTEHQIGATLTNAEVVRNPFLVSGSVLPWPPADDSSVRLACVGRLDPADKGQDILLRVLARPHWRERSPLVTFCGTGNNDEALRDLASHLSLTNVAFAGFVPDVESIWKAHHALLLPSRTEGLPLALIEAMKCGRFGIVTSEGGSAEVVEDGLTGFIAASARVDDFDAAMERAWDARERWECIGAAAAEAVGTLVPADPGAAFAEKLLGLANAS